MKHLGVVGVAAFALAVCDRSQASLVQVRDAVGGEFANGNPGGPLLDGTGSTLNGSASNGSDGPLYVGTFDLEADYGSGFTPLITYCIEPNQMFLFGYNPPDSVGITYQTDSLTNGHGFTATEANYVRILWANAWADSQTSAAKAAAFQSVVWEFTEDNSINLTAGNFRLNPADAYSDQVRGIAQGWIDNITGGVWTTAANLIVLTHPESQDYLAEVVPAPGAAVALVGGLMAIGLRRRRAS